MGAMGKWSQIDGHWYGIPMAAGLGGNLFYLPKLVKAAGLDPNNPPTTWDQLWAATTDRTIDSPSPTPCA